MKRHIKKTLKNSIGFTCIAIGVIGLFLPFIQGILLITLGFSILECEKKHKLKEWVKAKIKPLLKRLKKTKHHSI